MKMYDKITLALVPDRSGQVDLARKRGGAFRLLNYAVCEILGKQYKVIPNKPFEVDFLGEQKEIEANVLLLSEDDKLKIGNPFLKEKLSLKKIEDTRGEKIRVSRFHAKANYRRTTGHRAKLTKVVLA